MKHRVFDHNLACGAKGLVIDVPGSAVINIRVIFRSGFQFSDPRSYEVPHIMEHLLATVTQKHALPNSYIIEAQKNGAYVNASTSADTNEYIYEFAEFELDRMLDLIEEQLVEPLFNSEIFDAEKSNVREELTRNTTQHMSVATIRLAQQAFPELWQDYDTRLEQLSQIEIEQLRQHYIRTHTASNARFYIAGHFTDGGEVVVSRFVEMFNRLPQGERLQLSRKIGCGAAKPIVTSRDIDQVYYRTGKYFGELEETGRAAMSVLRMLMVGGMGSRVLGEARKRGLAYSVGAVGHSEPGNSSFGFTGYVTPSHAEALFEIITRSMAAVGEGQASLSELDAAKNLLVGSITRSTQTAGDILHWYTDRYEDEGIVKDFDQGLEMLRGVSMDEVCNLANSINRSTQQGISLLGRMGDKEISKYAQLLNS